jgi:hypothetical protein
MDETRASAPLRGRSANEIDDGAVLGVVVLQHGVAVGPGVVARDPAPELLKIACAAEYARVASPR